MTKLLPSSAVSGLSAQYSANEISDDFLDEKYFLEVLLKVDSMFDHVVFGLGHTVVLVPRPGNFVSTHVEGASDHPARKLL